MLKFFEKSTVLKDVGYATGEQNDILDNIQQK